MIYTLICDNESKDEKISNESLLSLALSRIGIFKTPKILRTEFGKPYTEDNSLYFNISNTDSLSVCTVSFERNVGVDIERVREIKNREKLEKRLLLGLDFGVFPINDEHRVEFLSIDKVGNITEEKFEKEKATVGFFTSWTRLEALIKCDGRGFSAIKETDKLNFVSLTDSLSIKYKGREYILSVAIKNKRA